MQDCNLEAPWAPATHACMHPGLCRPCCRPTQVRPTAKATAGVQEWLVGLLKAHHGMARRQKDMADLQQMMAKQQQDMAAQQQALWRELCRTAEEFGVHTM